MKIDVEALAKQADEHADRVHLIGGIRIRRDFRLNWQKTRDAEFARLVMEECVKVCNEVEQRHSEINANEWPEEQSAGEWGAKDCADAIRARMP